ncbi:MAG: hypothetical protein UY92_C0014G0028 [Candidatus Magasanikbacteria bacterium GW2011_GWA2_56_11]|uniref:Elp3/MiaA/NifB-like radical SAM core domain-containing protein n=1 Tax=Candidatus Magasanikbacteria bacterium GW2011_GWA2_56_11 TaxID=1619044 RepID=A0A0G1YDZ8_9BACT|nr:MAG: hypothetical protein UY92_C0014G0028 [Candidatus Magasanikbacteria bacterium GW2011_GWA2_56_11]
MPTDEQKAPGLIRDIRQTETEKTEGAPRSLAEIRQELGEMKVERRALRLRVTEEERAAEEEIRARLEEKITVLEQALADDGHENLADLADDFAASAELIHEARLAGLFELFELSEFDDRLVALYDRLREKNPSPAEETEGLARFEAEMSKEFLLRELEQLYNDTTQQVRALYEQMQAMAPNAVQNCAEGLCRCADDLFNFEVGGVLRVDEFVGYVNVLRENHAALIKVAAGREEELPERFTTLMQDVERLIAKHESNLADVKALLEGKENVMSFERYNELAVELAANYKYYIEWQRQMVKQSHSESISALKAGEIRKDEANWSGIGTTKDGRRFQIGLRGKKGCEYGRCANCCLFHGSADASITAADIATQFDRALDQEGLTPRSEAGKPEWSGEGQQDIYRIDFNGSGSFLNDAEMPREARLAIFDRLAKLPFTTILIESRVEYIDQAKIKELQDRLRPDQKLEMAIGLESANNLVRELSVAKGYSLEEFERSVEVLAAQGVDVLVYSIVKPALLKEKEALEDSLYTGRYLGDLAQRIKDKTSNPAFSLTMKLEQAFIQKGGYLDYLHNKKRKTAGPGAAGSGSPDSDSLYETPWSFTIANIVERLCDEGINKQINIQIGRSDDFPPPVDITRNRTPDGVPHNESTKAVDDAMQQFNIDGDAEKLSAALLAVQTSHPEVFAAWQAKLES